MRLYFSVKFCQSSASSVDLLLSWICFNILVSCSLSCYHMSIHILSLIFLYFFQILWQYYYKCKILFRILNSKKVVDKEQSPVDQKVTCCIWNFHNSINFSNKHEQNVDLNITIFSFHKSGFRQHYIIPYIFLNLKFGSSYTLHTFYEKHKILTARNIFWYCFLHYCFQEKVILLRTQR